MNNWRAAFVAHEWRTLLGELQYAGTAAATAQLWSLYHRNHSDWVALQLHFPQDATQDQRLLLHHLLALSTLDTLEQAAEALEEIPSPLHLAFT